MYFYFLHDFSYELRSNISIRSINDRCSMQIIPLCSGSLCLVVAVADVCRTEPSCLRRAEGRAQRERESERERALCACAKLRLSSACTRRSLLETFV